MNTHPGREDMELPSRCSAASPSAYSLRSAASRMSSSALGRSSCRPLCDRLQPLSPIREFCGAELTNLPLTPDHSIHASQWLGAPLYFYRREWYERYMAKTKEFFELTVITMTQWWGPTTIRVSGDADVSKQLSRTSDGRIECSFPERMVMIANHQVR